MSDKQREKALRRRRDRQWMRMLMASAGKLMRPERDINNGAQLTCLTTKEASGRPLSDWERLKRKLIYYFPEMATNTVGSLFDRPKSEPGNRPIDHWNELTLTAQWILVKTTSEDTQTGVAIAWVEQLSLPREELYQFFKIYLRYLRAYLRDKTTDRQKREDEALRLFTTLHDITELYRAPLPTDLITDEDVRRAVSYLEKINNTVHIEKVRKWVGPRSDFIYLPFEEQIWVFFGMRHDWEAALAGELDVHPDLCLGGGPLVPTHIEDGFDYDEDNGEGASTRQDKKPAAGGRSTELFRRIQEAGARIQASHDDIRPVQYINPRFLHKDPVDEFGHRITFPPENPSACREVFRGNGVGDQGKVEASNNHWSILRPQTQLGSSTGQSLSQEVPGNVSQEGPNNTIAKEEREEPADGDESDGSPKNLYRERQEKLFGVDLSNLCEDEDDDDYAPPRKRRSGQRKRGKGRAGGSPRGAGRGRPRKSDVQQTEATPRGRGRGRGRPRGSRSRAAAGSSSDRATVTQAARFPTQTVVGNQQPGEVAVGASTDHAASTQAAQFPTPTLDGYQRPQEAMVGSSSNSAISTQPAQFPIQTVDGHKRLQEVIVGSSSNSATSTQAKDFPAQTLGSHESPREVAAGSYSTADNQAALSHTQTQGDRQHPEGQQVAADQVNSQQVQGEQMDCS